MHKSVKWTYLLTFWGALCSILRNLPTRDLCVYIGPVAFSSKAFRWPNLSIISPFSTKAPLEQSLQWVYTFLVASSCDLDVGKLCDEQKF